MTYKENRILHRRKLSATEKLQTIQALKLDGMTQQQIADELGCSIRTVKSYWNSIETISKQEANKKPKRSKREWKRRSNFTIDDAALVTTTIRCIQSN